MEKKDAAQIVAFLIAAFPGVTLEEASVEIWVQLVAELHDAESASKTALDYAKTGERFPTFPEFRRTYLRLKERTTDGVAVAELMSGPELDAPGWVRMYHAIRPGDQRAFPDQEVGYRSLRMEWPPEVGVIPKGEIDQWVAENPAVDGAKQPVLSSSGVLRDID